MAMEIAADKNAIRPESIAAIKFAKVKCVLATFLNRFFEH